MKINVSAPSCGTIKCYDVEDEAKLRHLFDKRMGQEFPGELISPELTGYIVRVTGGSDKTGFPMRQGVLSATRVTLLLKAGSIGFQKWRGRKGERRRKTIRGCIVGPDIASLNIQIVKDGPERAPGLNAQGDERPRRLGPKRASRLRKLFGLTKSDDVRQFVLKRKIPAREAADGKPGRKEHTKGPKIQRLVTAALQHRLKRKKAALLERWRRAKAARQAYQAKLDRMRHLKRERDGAKKRRIATAQAKAALRP